MSRREIGGNLGRVERRNWKEGRKRKRKTHLSDEPPSRLEHLIRAIHHPLRVPFHPMERSVRKNRIKLPFPPQAPQLVSIKLLPLDTGALGGGEGGGREGGCCGGKERRGVIDAED